jgi:hypothetical protein
VFLEFLHLLTLLYLNGFKFCAFDKDEFNSFHEKKAHVVRFINSLFNLLMDEDLMDICMYGEGCCSSHCNLKRRKMMNICAYALGTLIRKN